MSPIEESQSAEETPNEIEAVIWDPDKSRARLTLKGLLAAASEIDPREHLEHFEEPRPKADNEGREGADEPEKSQEE